MYTSTPLQEFTCSLSYSLICSEFPDTHSLS